VEEVWRRPLLEERGRGEVLLYLVKSCMVWRRCGGALSLRRGAGVRCCYIWFKTASGGG